MDKGETFFHHFPIKTFSLSRDRVQFLNPNRSRLFRYERIILFVSARLVLVIIQLYVYFVSWDVSPMTTQRFKVTLEFMLTSPSLRNAFKSVAPKVITRRENSSDFAANLKPLLTITCLLRSAIFLTMISLFLRRCQITTVTPVLYIML